MSQSPVEFGQRLRALRATRGLSLRALAERAGVSSVTIWKWESGATKPRPRMIEPLAAALGVLSSYFQTADDKVGQIKKEAKLGDFPSATNNTGKNTAPRNLPDSVELLADVIEKAKK